MWGKRGDNIRLSCKIRTKEIKKMSKIKKIMLGVGIAGAVGITYVVVALKGMPEAFDWEHDEDD